MCFIQVQVHRDRMFTVGNLHNMICRMNGEMFTDTENCEDQVLVAAA